MPKGDHPGVTDVLARKAAEDATAVREFAGNPRVADSVIGFHAQQAIEKWLKAVVAKGGGRVERTHDLDRLIEVAQINGQSLPVDADDVIALTQYAVPFRYDDLLDSPPLDRQRTLTLITLIEDWANGLIG